MRTKNAVESVGVSDGLYHWFLKRLFTAFGSASYRRIEQSRSALPQAAASGDRLGTGAGLLTAHAVSAGCDVALAIRNIGVVTGLTRDLLAAGTLLANHLGLDAPARDSQAERLLSKVQKNLFKTLAFIVRKPAP